MGGLEPPTVYLPLELQTRLLYQLSYTTYHYHAQRISCAIMFNNVAYQAATDGRAFQLIPLILVSVVRSSTSGLLVASDTDNTPLRHRNHCRSGVQRLEPPPCCQSCLCNMSKNVSPFIICGRCRIRTCDVPDSRCHLAVGYSSLPSTTRPTFRYIFAISFSFRKPANLAAGWVRIAYVLKRCTLRSML